MSIEPIVSRFRKLSSDEKIRLVQEFWDEIAEEVARMPLTESQRRLLDERLADEEHNPGRCDEPCEGDVRHSQTSRG